MDHLVAQRLDRARERGGLARTRAGHQIEQECPALAQRPAQLLRLAIVIGEYALFDLNNANISHELPTGISLSYAVQRIR